MNLYPNPNIYGIMKMILASLIVKSHVKYPARYPAKVAIQFNVLTIVLVILRANIVM